MESTKNKPSPPSKKQLTPQQQKALATDKNISVTAGAGSGKTMILVERYLKIILDEKVDIRKVLAITFTEKAAAEMTERVSRMIRERLVSETNPQTHQRLWELRERLNSAQISTIHAFCARTLREFAVASGVDPDFSVLSDFQLDLLINESIENIFEQLDQGTIEGPYTSEEWMELLRQVPPNILRESLSHLLRQPYETEQLRKRMEDAHSDEELLQELSSLFLTTLQNYLPPGDFLDRMIPLLQQLYKIVVPVDKLKDNGQRLFHLVETIVRLDDHSPEDMALWQLFLDISAIITTKGQPYQRLSGIGKKADLGEAYPLLLELSEKMSPLGMFCVTVFSTAPSRQDLLHFQALRKILFLYQLVKEAYRQKKEERGVLDFDDLQILALETIRNNSVVQNELRNRYRYIMVDEFQDTNQLQWEIISLMGTLDGELQEDKFFVVGDPKQSIYGFRNADVRVFQKVKETFAAKGSDQTPFTGNITLNESFRFLPSVNHFVNYLFAKVLAADAGNEFEVPYDELTTRRDLQDIGHIEAAFFRKDEMKRDDLSQEDYIARKIAGLLNLIDEAGTSQADGNPVEIYRRIDGKEIPQAIRPGDIAILIPRRTHLIELESKLREYGIPFKTIGGIGFYRRQEIFDVYHLLRFLDNPADDLALTGLLRSPFAGLTDAALFYLSLERGRTYREKLNNIGDISAYPEIDRKPLEIFRKQLSRWERRRDRLSLSRLLNEIFDESMYRAAAAAEWNGEQLLANIDKILEMAREYEQSGFMALSDFIDSLHRTILQDPREGEAQIALEDEGTVKIMTVHQAKGLEFPVVFCPYLQQTPRGNTGKYCTDADLGLAVKIRAPQNGYRETTPFLYDLIRFRQNQKQLAELKRLFYVTVTRARDRVYLIGTYSNSELAGENCLSWTARALDLDPKTFDGTHLTLNDQLKVKIALRFEPQEIPASQGRQKVKPSLKQLAGTLAEPLTEKERKNLPVHLRKISDRPKGVTFSATQLLTYRLNPENYFRRYHLGFFESDYEFLKQVSDPDNMSLLKGKVIHKILENGLPDNPAAILEQLEHAFFQYEVFDREQQTELQGEIPEMIRRFAKEEYSQKIFSAQEWKTEISLTMKMGADFFTGTLDRIFRNSEGNWEVADYKTNRITAKGVEKTGKKYEIQMKSYALLMAQIFPGQAEYPVSLYFLLPGLEFRQVYSPKNIEEIKNEFISIIEEIKQFYPFGEQLPVR